MWLRGYPLLGHISPSKGFCFHELGCALTRGSSNDTTVCEDVTEWKSGLGSRQRPVGSIVLTSLELESNRDAEAAASTRLEVWLSALTALALN